MTGPAPVRRDAAPSRDGALRRPEAGRPSAGPRLWAFPHVRQWLLLGIVLSAAVVALGLAAQLTPGFSAAELGVDQDLSQHHAAALTAVAMALNVVFGPVAGLALIGAAALYIWLFRGGVVKALAFGLVASSGWVASEFFKIIVARQRPNPALLFDPLAPETGSNSFPSGHVSFAVALGFAVYFLARGTRWAKVTAVGAAAMALVVAWSRLYIGVHYPTDVAASFLAASAAVVMLAGLWNVIAPRIADRLRAPSAIRSPGPERK
ncbi:phosphatase PAP2 family protein [Arthrobacter sp. ok362]|uniref:phosphatase PAP2 family protein n=1 Tax=Arthrobacter sp. ok362 TaxID=1761745 RepID=UPI00088AB6F4|nr:phosphatase PAP2 family protein [Arthrobacter sp. ok362]SDL66537.1 undecaprenyl-diphosphatase [Arthrobacter sp. ok362]